MLVRLAGIQPCARMKATLRPCSLLCC